MAANSNMRVLVVTVSDSVSRGEAEDRSGPLVVELVQEQFPDAEVSLHVVSDDVSDIEIELMRNASGSNPANLILTTGGTGFSGRDYTPEATRSVIEREAPGLTHAMMGGSLSVTPMAALSRAVAGIRDATLIVNLPGSPKGAAENYKFLSPVLPHALDQIAGTNLKHHPTGTVGHGGGSGSVSKGHSHGHHHGGPGCAHSGVIVSKDGTRTKASRVSKYPKVPVDEALRAVLSHAERLPSEEVPLYDAVGCVLATPVSSPFNVPPFPASIKDGYAVVAADGEGEFPVVGFVTAGRVADFTLEAGSIAKITTGSPLPPGADAIVMIEDTELVETNEDGSEAVVRILRGAKAGQDIRTVGSDVAEGELILTAGTRIGFSEVGLIATAGLNTVTVTRSPTVGVMSTGDEVIDPGNPLAPGQIYDSNRHMLLAAVAEAGGTPVDLGVAPDSQDKLTEKVREALGEVDILVTSGGVSMGELDLLKTVLGEMGVVHFGRVLMKPGLPTTFSTVKANKKQRLVFSLPGNPVSCIVTFNLFVLPALREMAGWQDPHLPRVNAVVKHEMEMDPARPNYHRAIMKWENGVFCAESTGFQRSSRLASMRGANALLIIPQGEGVVAEGEVVEALLIGPASAAGY